MTVWGAQKIAYLPVFLLDCRVECYTMTVVCMSTKYFPTYPVDFHMQIFKN